jgi:hypothetical protein
MKPWSVTTYKNGACWNVSESVFINSAKQSHLGEHAFLIGTFYSVAFLLYCAKLFFVKEMLASMKYYLYFLTGLASNLSQRVQHASLGPPTCEIDSSWASNLLKITQTWKSCPFSFFNGLSICFTGTPHQLELGIFVWRSWFNPWEGWGLRDWEVAIWLSVCISVVYNDVAERPYYLKTSLLSRIQNF